jgi:hypothetical protein
MALPVGHHGLAFSVSRPEGIAWARAGVDSRRSPLVAVALALAFQSSQFSRSVCRPRYGLGKWSLRPLNAGRSTSATGSGRAADRILLAGIMLDRSQDVLDLLRYEGLDRGLCVLGHLQSLGRILRQPFAVDAEPEEVRKASSFFRAAVPRLAKSHGTLQLAPRCNPK